jgi:hypothetical protein
MSELIDSINWALLLPFFIIQIILAVVAIIDWVKNQENIRGNRFVWLIVIILINIAGPITYFIFGRRS